MNPGFSEFLRAAPRDRRDVFLGAATRLGTPEQNIEKGVKIVLDCVLLRLRAGLRGQNRHQQCDCDEESFHR
jgi:hypothetical protein